MRLTTLSLLGLVSLPAAAFAGGPFQPGDQDFIPVAGNPTAAGAGATGGSMPPMGSGTAATQTASAVSVATTGSTSPDAKATGEADQEAQGGLHYSAGVSSSVGLGTFVSPATASYLATIFNVGASYGFDVKGHKLIASAGWLGYYELTLPDDGSGRRFAPWDIRPSLAAPNLWTEKHTGIALSPSVGLTIPSSIESVHATLITALSAGVSATKKLGPFGLRLSVNGSRSFYALPFNPTWAQTAPANEPTIFIGRVGETFINTAGMNPAWTLISGAGVTWSPTKAISVAVGYTYLNVWKYAAADSHDQYTPQALDSNGGPVAREGMGRSDRVIGTIAVSYAINDHFGVDLSMFTAQAPLIKDNHTGLYTPRFPWLAYGQLADNASSVSFGLSGNF